MGKYKKQDTTDATDLLVGIHTSKIEDTETKEKARGVGFTKKEAESDAWKKLKTEPEKSSEPSGGDSGSSNEGGGCYLSTACVNAVGLSDNCLELETLRVFRDKVLMLKPSGRKAVREYYRIAPKIVQAIEKQNDAQSIWQDIFRDIRCAAFLILSGDFEKAFKHYQQMTLMLKEKYLD